MFDAGKFFFTKLQGVQKFPQDQTKFTNTLKQTIMKATLMLVLGIAAGIILAGIIQKSVKQLNPNV